MKLLVCVLGIMTISLAACAPRPEPTPDPAEVQAAAATMLALTQAAIPPSPVPSETPEPSATPYPTLTPTATATLESPTASSQSSDTGCVHSLNLGQAGPLHPTLLRNEASGTVNLSLNLIEPNEFGECGAVSYANFAKNSSQMVQLPSGYWYAYAWGTVKGSGFQSSGSFFVQPAQFDKIELCVRDNNIVYKPQC
jgi:hypothetical protein